jgi:NitT/TauT family transport system substrate-binding protein
MQLRTKAMLLVVAWLVLISALHSWLNVNWAAVLNDYRPIEKRKIIVAYLPVTCQLTCPGDRLHFEIFDIGRRVPA